MKLRKVIASVLSVMTVCSMLPTPALAYENNDVQPEVTKLQTSAKIEKKTPESSGASSHSQETAALVASGNCGENGDNVQWAFYESGTLYIYGIGNMKNYSSAYYMPCKDYREQIQTVIIETGVTSIGSYSLSRCINLTSVNIPNTIISIGYYAFEQDEGLTSVIIPDSVTSIGSAAFNSCRGITSFTIPNSVTSIGSGAFNYCTSLTSITLPENLNKIDSELFRHCQSLTSITIPSTVTSIGTWAFGECTSLANVEIPDSVTSIGQCAFDQCDSFTTISVSKYVTDISSGAFQNCTNLTSVNIDSDNPNYISENGIVYKKDKTTLLSYPAGKTEKSFTVSHGILCIDYGAFRGCKLNNIRIPATVRIIGISAFEDCGSLADVYYNGTQEQWNTINIASSNDSFFNSVSMHYEPPVVYSSHELEIAALVASGDCGENGSNVQWSLYESGTMYIYGSGKMQDYSSASNLPYKDYKSQVVNLVIEPGVTAVGNNVFYGFSSLMNTSIANTVTGFGDSTFYSCSRLKSIDLPNNLTSIGKNAFFSSGITSIKLPNSMTSIGERAFRGCVKMTNIEIPNTVTSIGDYAFANDTELENIVIPNSVTDIGSNAFYFCNKLKRIEIGNGLQSIGNNAFAECSKLQNVYFMGTDYQWNSISLGSGNGYLNNANIHCMGSVSGTGHETEMTELIACDTCSGVYGESVFWAFYESGTLYIYGNGHMKNYTDTVSVPYYESYRNKIKKIVVEFGVQNLGSYAFAGCGNSTEIEISDSVTSIGECTFSGCKNLTELEISDNITSIGKGAFGGCGGLTSLTIPNTVTRIEDYTFSGCSGLTNITIPNSVTYIGEYVFRGCSSLASIVLPNSITQITNNMFIECDGLQSLNIPNGVTSIGICAFENCVNLVNIGIPNSVTSIGRYAFEQCNALKNITIPASVTSIESNAFFNSVGLLNVNVDSSNTKFSSEDGILYNKNKTSLLLYPAGRQANSYTINQGVTSIGDHAFAYCHNLTNVVFPDTLTSIGKYSFGVCDNLKSITLPNSLTSIGTYAFGACESLQNIEIPESVTEIKDYAFSECYSFTSIKIPDGIPNIQRYTFEFCHGLKSIAIPKSITSVGIGAFRECENFTDIYYAGTETEWNAISIDDNNTPFTSATVHYNYRDKYNVVYDMNGGTGSILNQNKLYGQDLKLSSTKPTRTGYTFIGWNTNKNAQTAEYQSGDIYTENADLTLYAIWLPQLINASSVSNANPTVGSSVKITGSATGGTSNYTYEFYYKKQGASSWSKFGLAYQTENTATLKASSAGTFIVRTYAKDGYSSAVKDFTITFTAPLANKTTVTSTNPTTGTAVTINGSATGGTGNYTYQFYYKRQSASSWSTFGANYQTENTATLKASSAGVFIVRTYAKDGKSSVVKDFTITFTAPLTNKTTVTTTAPKVGTAVKINGSATGGIGTYTYEFYYKRQGASSWSTFGANYKTDTTATLKASSAGSFDVRVHVKDSSGKTAVKNFIITYSK